NVLAHRVWSKGDVDEGFRRADFILQRRYTTPRVHQGYLEPHCCVVHVHPDGSADIWATNKTPFMAREQLAAGLGLNPESLTMHVMPLGGDFGGKGSVMDLPIAYCLSKAVGAPVRLAMTYVAEFTSAAPRHAAIVSIKTGVTNDGRIVAHQVRALYDSGAYGAFKPSPTLDLQGAAKAAGPYRMDSMKIEAILVYTNQVPCGHMRAPGLPQVVFALESHLDAIARQLDIDPLEFRLRNVIRDGEPAPNGELWRDVRAYETLQAVAAAANWGAPLPPNHGRGVALAEHGTGAGFGSMKLEFDARGFTVITAVPDTGTGSHTVLQQVAAEELGVPASKVRVEHGQTDQLPLDSGVGGSKTTHVHGQAVAHAARELRARLVERTAKALGAAPDDAAWDSGAVVVAGARHDPWEIVPEPMAVETQYDGSGAPRVTSFCAQVAEVAVDVETGHVRVTRVVSANDAGTVINPIGHLGQIEGGVAQGLGYALIEELPLAEGRVTAQSFADYKIPAFGDVPPIETVTLENPSGPAPYHAKGIGETPNVPLAAAIANAIEDAVGARIVDLPITAERVHTALSRRAHAHHHHHHHHGPHGHADQHGT
ncbi:MAG: molybdopterin-dependent oxidoreductase, partial [Dehalococcoidia bacterium]|nr:molybdopterin-dependent oxidoreductase [Dehalococcoidia bacterium]